MENLSKKINIGPLIEVGHEKNCKFMLQKTHQTWKYLQTLGKIQKSKKCRAFKKAVGPGKKSKINKPRAYVYSGL